MENHYIPQFYSKRWTHKADGKLFVYRRAFKKVIVEKRLPVQIGFEEDLYTVPFVPDDVKYMLETVFFKRIDQEGHDALSKMEAGGVNSLDQNERFAWAIFMVAMIQRHPIKVAHLARSTEEYFSNFLDESKDRYYSTRKEDDLRPFQVFKTDALASEQIAQQKKMAIQSGILIPKTINWIGNAVMAVLTFTNDHSLLTSDRPIVISNGLKYEYSHIAIPISPCSLFVAAQSRELIIQICKIPNLISQVNDNIVRQSEEFVFGADPYHLVFVEARLKHMQKQRLAGRAKKKRTESKP